MNKQKTVKSLFSTFFSTKLQKEALLNVSVVQLVDTAYLAKFSTNHIERLNRFIDSK